MELNCNTDCFNFPKGIFWDIITGGRTKQSARDTASNFKRNVMEIIAMVLKTLALLGSCSETSYVVNRR